MERKDRNLIELEGLPLSIVTLLKHYNIELEALQVIKEIRSQIRGIDFAINADDSPTMELIAIDSKYHRKPNKRGTNGRDLKYISIEITKANGARGWGTNRSLVNNIIVDITKGYKAYIMDANALRWYMVKHHREYEILYNSKGYEDYRAVPVEDLKREGIIIDSIDLKDMEEEVENLKHSEAFKAILRDFTEGNDYYIK